MKNDSFSNAEKDLQLKLFTEKIEALEKENFKLKKILEQYGIAEDKSSFSDIEYICVKQIEMLKTLADKTELSTDEVKNLDTLHKNLRQVRDTLERKELETKTEDIAELLSIVDGAE